MVHREMIRFVASVAIVLAIATMAFRVPEAQAEGGGGGTCVTSDPFHACVITTFQQGKSCSSGCSTCYSHTSYHCAPVGSGVDEQDWVRQE